MRWSLGFCVWLTLVVGAGLCAEASGAGVTLRGLGAVGDGKTDDRAAIEKGLNQSKGVTIDGEGLTYAVRGSIQIDYSAHLRNATFVQVMEPGDASKFFSGGWGGGSAQFEPADLPHEMKNGLPAMSALGYATYANDPLPTEAERDELMQWIGLRTLLFEGAVNRTIGVTLENVKVDRGKHPEGGGRSDSTGIQISYGSPVVLRNVEVTGDGKGTGVGITHCRDVKIEGLNIHDMLWAPYRGDKIFEVLKDSDVRDLFRYNNFPIYDYRPALKRFVRVRVQEQMSGMRIAVSQNVEIVNSRIERLGTLLSGKFYAIQADGLTINRAVHTLIRHCEFNAVWEGIDFTGGGGSDFVFEDNRSIGAFGWGFKLAHAKQNGKILRCMTERAGIGGFTMAGDQHDITIRDSIAYESGADQYWEDGSGQPLTKIVGFNIDVVGPPSPTPRKLRLERCKAINKEHRNAIEHGVLVNSPRGQQDVAVVDFESEGARGGAIEGL